LLASFEMYSANDFPFQDVCLHAHIWILVLEFWEYLHKEGLCTEVNK